MRFATIVSASFLAAATLSFASAAEANIAITIDKSAQQMSVAVDGSQRYTWPVSTGRPGYDTPNGNFKINRMDADHFSQEWDNAPMPHTMFFDLHGHAIHGFSDVKHLGMAVSHGCVRLSPDHATTLFDLVKAQGMANTSVAVTGHTPGGGNVPVARAHLPENETVYNAQPLSIAPQDQQGYQRQYQEQPPQYQGQYQQQVPQYQQQQYPPPQDYAQRQGFPPQPQPYYAQPRYAQPQPSYGNQGYYGGQQGYYQQPQPYYRQW